MEIEGSALPTVKARPRRRITAAVMEASQFLFEVVGPERGADIGRMMLGEAAVRGQSTARSKRQHFHGISTVAAWLATKVYVPGGRNAN
jgi:hypothetical protein